jgi:hypothetical protein
MNTNGSGLNEGSWLKQHGGQRLTLAELFINLLIQQIFIEYLLKVPGTLRTFSK